MKKAIVNITAQRQYTAAKSEEMQNTVTSTPGWLIRYGLSVFFITLLVITGFGMIVRFPEHISAPASVTSENGLQAIRIWIEEKDTANLRDGQKAIVTIQEQSPVKKWKVEGKTGIATYSQEDKKYYVPLLIAPETAIQKFSNGQIGEAKITYGERTLLQQILDKSK